MQSAAEATCTDDEGGLLAPLLRAMRAGSGALIHRNDDPPGDHAVMNAIHETADGRHFFVKHGDKFDAIVKHSP